MALAEMSSQVAEKYNARMDAKKEQMPQIKEELTYFKNEKFKNRVAELCQWCILQLGNSIYIQIIYFKMDLKESLF